MSERQQVESYSFLHESGLMEKDSLDGQFEIGRIVHSPELKQAVSEGKLDILLHDLGNLYRDIYGRKPWNEYLVCSNSACGEKMTLSEEKDLNTADEDFAMHPEKHACRSCGGQLDFFYEPKNTINSLRDLFQGKVFACLLLQKNSAKKPLSGFSLGCETTLRNGYDDKIIKGKKEAELEMTYEDFIEEIRRLLGCNFSEDQRTFNMAEVAKEKSIRKPFGALLVHELFSLAQKKMKRTPDEKIPIVAHTIAGSPIVTLGQNIGVIGHISSISKEVRLYSTIDHAVAMGEKLLHKT